MHDVDDRDARGASPGEEIRDTLDGARGAGENDLPNRREVLLLGVNNQERGVVHRGASLSRGERRAGACYHSASVNHALGIGGVGDVSGEVSLASAGPVTPAAKAVPARRPHPAPPSPRGPGRPA